MTVYTVEKSLHSLNATKLMSDFDDVNFPVTVVSPFASHLNSIGVI
jgi:hypothetical protein